MREYTSLLSDKVAIVSVMWANNESGTLFPVEEMAMLAQSAGVMFHTDAVQAVGKLPINLRDSAIDMLSLSGHKLHAPKGIGVLYLRRNTRFYAETPVFVRCCAVDTRSGVAAPVPRTRPPSSLWGGPVS